jgi:hypothetical protein
MLVIPRARQSDGRSAGGGIDAAHGARTGLMGLM